MGQALGKAVRALIQEKKISAFQLASEVDIDRTTLQHFFTGKRKVPLKTLQKMMTVLNLTKEKRKILYTLYEKECDDKEMIKNAQDILSLYKAINDHIDLSSKQAGLDEYGVKNGIFHGKTQIVKGQVKIDGLIRSCFIEEMGREEKAHVTMSVNFKNSFLYESMIRIANGQNKCGKIQNIIPLVNKKKLGNNLDVLKAILPLKCLDNVEYEPYYFYTGTKIYDDISIIVPNYFITSKQVITIDRDFESAIIFEDPSIIEYYREKSQAILNRCERLVEKKMISCSLKSVPAFEKVGKDGGVTQFYAFDQVYRVMKEATKQSLKSEEKNSAYSPHKKESDLSRKYILRDSFMSESGKLSIRYLEDEERVEFLIADKNDEKSMVLSVTEIGITTVFKEFLHYLPNSFYVYAQEELNPGLRNLG